MANRALIGSVLQAQHRLHFKTELNIRNLLK
jgi:hypothetical protein